MESRSLLLVFLLVAFIGTTAGCYVKCPQSSHCKSYYDLSTGCSTCTCSDRLVKEVCPNRMICRRNCPVVKDQSTGCYKCACMFFGQPFNLRGRF